MASIELTRTDLIVRIHGWSIVRALRHSLRVPLGHVVAVRVRPQEARFDDFIIEGWRGIGVYTPRKCAAGLVNMRGGRRAFFEVRDGANTIALDLEGQRIRHLVLQLDYESAEDAGARVACALESYYGFRRAPAPTLAPEEATGRLPISAVTGSLGVVGLTDGRQRPVPAV
jgi:hypothetical protein